MKTASTREIIEYLQAYEKIHGIGVLRSITGVLDGSKTIKCVLSIMDKNGKEIEVEIPVVEEDDLWKDKTNTEFNWDKFKTEDIAVHTKTIEEYKDFIEQAKKIRLKFNGVAPELYFDLYEDNTCIDFDIIHQHLTFSPAHCYREKDYTILEWKDYMEG